MHKDWIEEQWMKVMFSDEIQIKQFQEKHTTIRRRSGEMYNPKNTVSTVKTPGGHNVNVCTFANSE